MNAKDANVLRISDLSSPVTSAKADWIRTSTWLGFSPTTEGTASRAQCQSVIQRQIAGGYVLEYITETAEKPNAGFDDDPQYLAEKQQHLQNRGRFVAIHRLRHSARSLPQILGESEFSRLQDMWAQGGKRWRWSVAFPIIETFEIVDSPKAKSVFDPDSYRRLFAHSSATLRPLNEHEQFQLNNLEIRRVPAANSWIAIADEMNAVEASQINSRTIRLMESDLAQGALEGETEERKTKIRKRAAWLADTFIRRRVSSRRLVCDICKFDPSSILNTEILSARSILDVHHKFPLEEGSRYTSIEDFALLCPTCHRIEHQLIKKSGSLFASGRSPQLFSSNMGDSLPL